MMTDPYRQSLIRVGPSEPGAWPVRARLAPVIARSGTGGSLASLAAATPWLVIVFLVSMLLPNEAGFQIGSFRLFPYRVVLICAFAPCLLRVLSMGAGPIRTCDALLAFFGLWMIVALSRHHGLESGLESGGILVAESCGAYLIGRAWITNARAFAGTVALLVLVVIGLAAFTIPEAITGRHVIRELGSAVFGASGLGRVPDPRFGLQRAFGPFDHPIHYGVFCASVVGLSFYALALRDRGPMSRWARTAAVVVSAFMSVSSGAMVAVVFQLLLVGWDRVLQGIRQRWALLLAATVVAWIAVDALSNRGPMRVALTYLTFSPATAYNRMLIWEYGTAEVARSPLFGIGFNDWVRPDWMHSGSMDNFWLVIAVQFGMPAALAVGVALAGTLVRLMRIRDASVQLAACRMGWVVSMAGVSMAGATVHFWGVLYAYFFFLLGAGTWMLGAAQNANTSAPAPAAATTGPTHRIWRS